MIGLTGTSPVELVDFNPPPWSWAVSTKKHRAAFQCEESKFGSCHSSLSWAHFPLWHISLGTLPPVLLTWFGFWSLSPTHELTSLVRSAYFGQLCLIRTKGTHTHNPSKIERLTVNVGVPDFHTILELSSFPRILSSFLCCLVGLQPAVKCQKIPTALIGTFFGTYIR